MKSLIVTIPTRIAYSKELLNSVDAELVIDAEMNLCKNHFRAWEKGWLSGEEYIMVLQDDIELCDNFADKIQSVLEDMKKNGYLFVSLYSNRKEDVDALDKGVQYRKAKNWLNEQGVIVHKSILPGYFNFFNKNIHNYKSSWHDQLWQDYTREYNIDIWVHVPSLVNHRIDIKSAVNHPSKTGGRTRTSRTFTK